jgi:hypothetical protein
MDERDRARDEALDALGRRWTDVPVERIQTAMDDVPEPFLVPDINSCGTWRVAVEVKQLLLL